MQLSIAAKMPYADLVHMSYNERKILLQVLEEKIAAGDPKKQKQVKMTPGQVNGPQGPVAPRTESR
jgi:hypothetical protein